MIALSGAATARVIAPLPHRGRGRGPARSAGRVRVVQRQAPSPALALRGSGTLSRGAGEGLSGSAASFLRGGGALGVEALDMAAFGAGGRVDHGVDQRRLSRGERLAYGLCQARRVGAVIALAAERLDELLVARITEQTGRRIRLVGGVAAVDAIVVEDDRRYRQPVAADRPDLHAAEAEGAVALALD